MQPNFQLLELKSDFVEVCLRGCCDKETCNGHTEQKKKKNGSVSSLPGRLSRVQQPVTVRPQATDSAVLLGHFGGVSVLVVSDHISPPLPQALHLARLQLGQVLLLHVYPAELGAKGIVGNVLLLLDL